VSGTANQQLYDAFGAYVRSQRQLAQLTLRQAAQLASISNPYLSQIEHGLVLPSIAVLSALADALSVSAETMLLRAAGIPHSYSLASSPQTEESIRQDPRLDNSQKHALLAVLASFVGSAPGVLVIEPAADIQGAVGEIQGVVSEIQGAVSESPVSETATAGEPAVASESVQGAARRVTSARTSAHPAAAGRAASHRRKGV